MRRLFSLIALLGALIAGPSFAANCPSFTYILSNGTTADANQVMSNFNTLLNCSNNNLAHSGTNDDIITLLAATSAPNLVLVGGNGALLSTNNLSDLASTSAARANLGLGTAAVQNIGASGANLCLLNVNCAFSGDPTFSGGFTATEAGTFTGNIIMSNTVASGLRTILWETSGSLRWTDDLDPTAETGDNAGSNRDICRFSDTGTLIDCPIVMNRSDGTVFLADGATIGSTANGLLVENGLAVVGTASATAFSGPLNGNATTATALATPRVITLTGAVTSTCPSFDGSAPISCTTSGNFGATAGTIAQGNDSRFGGPTQNSQSAAYGLVLTDAGGQVYHPSADTTPRTWTIPANASVAFNIGTKIDLINDCSAGALTIAISSDTLVWFTAGSTGSRTLAACGEATLTKVTATRWIIVGVGIS